MYSMPRSILPKFLWHPVLEYLSTADIYKLDIVHKYFDDVLNNDDWK